MLFGYRGLRTILSQYNRSTQDLFICWGPYSDGMVSFFQRRTMRRALAGSISNIFARNELLSEGNLTYLLTQIDYLFIGSSTYPVSSSIAIRAAFLGKKIICDGGDSAIRDFIAHYQTGHVIENLSQLGQIVAADDSMPIDQARLADWYSKENLKRVLDNYLEVTP